jgi:nucleoporin NDC1
MSSRNLSTVIGRKLHEQRHSSAFAFSETEISSRKHPYYLNGRLLFLILAQLWLAASFVLRNIMLDRFVFKWTKSSNSTELVRLFLPFCIVVADLSVAIYSKHPSKAHPNYVSLHHILVDGV